MAKKPKVEKTRNAGTMSESAYWGMIRSCLRNKSRWWKPRQLALQQAKQHYNGPNPRQKFEYHCCMCNGYFSQKEVEVDHVVPAGSLRCAEDLAGFVERLFAEEGWRVVCKPCHQKITNNERQRIK